jgi:hypothetical protein
MNSTDFLAPRTETVHSPHLPTPAPLPVPHHPPKKNRRRQKRALFFIAAALLFVLIAFLSLGAWNLIRGGLALRQAKDDAEAALEAGDLDGGKAALDDLYTALLQTRSGLRHFAFLSTAPFIGDQVKGTLATLDAAVETTEVLRTGLSIFLEALDTIHGAGGAVAEAGGGHVDVSYSSLNEEEKYLLLKSLAGSLPELRKMQVKLRLAERDLARLKNLDLLPQIKEAIAPFEEKLPELMEAVDIVVPFAAISPEFAGLGEEKQFLLLFLNNDEIRPGGGFIGVYGLMLVKNGDMVSLVTDDSYNIDAYVRDSEEYFVTPPRALRKYLVPEWYFRDSAWSPDFSQTARDATQLFRQEIGWSGQPVPEIHGVVGITPTFIARLLGFVGPVTVDGQTFTSENIAEQLEYQVEQQYAIDGIPNQQRKEIVSQVTDVMVDRLMDMSPSMWPDFFKILHAGFAEKEFGLMSYDDRTQAVLEDSGWAGVVNPAASDDLVMVVDANMGALKTDPEVKRHITYSIKPYGKGFRATTSIEYKNTATKNDWRTTRYRTFTRVYAPLGSTFVSSTGSLDNDRTKNPTMKEDTVAVVDELGMTSFGAFTAVELQETRTLSFTYDLPANVVAAIKRGDYSLQTFKQVGALDNLLTLDLDFGNTVTGAEPPEEKKYWGDDIYHQDSVLDTDKAFRIRTR